MNLSSESGMGFRLIQLPAVANRDKVPVGPFLGRPSADQFRHEIALHRERVLQMGLQVAENFLGEFPSLASLSKEDRTGLVSLYLSLHDLPKLMNLEELRSFSYKGSKTIFSCLHDVYGGQLGSRPQFIQDLNEIESRMKDLVMTREFSGRDSTFFLAFMAELQLIEEIVDLTDTKISRGRELGFVAQPFAAASYFLDNQSPLAALVSSWLERTHYQASPRGACAVHPLHKGIKIS